MKCSQHRGLLAGHDAPIPLRGASIMRLLPASRDSSNCAEYWRIAVGESDPRTQGRVRRCGLALGLSLNYWRGPTRVFVALTGSMVNINVDFNVVVVVVMRRNIHVHMGEWSADVDMA